MSNTQAEREMLEAAAKALGGEFSPGHTQRRTGDTWDEWEWIGPLGISIAGVTIYPQHDDGHGARMEAELGISVDWMNTCVGCIGQNFSALEKYKSHAGDKQAARRMASLRVAAEIGRSMK